MAYKSYSAISTAAALSANVKNTRAKLYGLQCYSIDATPVWVKLYNKATAATASDTPVMRHMIPANATAALGAGFIALSWPDGVNFDLGLSVRAVSGIADNDTGALSANEVTVNIQYD